MNDAAGNEGLEGSLPEQRTRRHRKRRKRLWLRLIAYALLGYVTWCAALYCIQDRLIFPADVAPRPMGDPPAGNTTVIKLDIETGGQVEAWFVPASSTRAGTPAPAVVFFHGNAEIIDYQTGMVAGYHRLGCSVLLPEYRGYGRAGGTPSERAIVADAVRFYDMLAARPGVDASRIVLHGRSLGGGIAAQVAAQRKPAALILESTFASAASMAHSYAAPSFLVRHPFRTDEVVAAIGVPLLIFHGTRDPIISVHHGRRLHRLAPASVYVEYDCGHNEFPCPRNEQAYWSEIAKFLGCNGIIPQVSPAHEDGSDGGV